MPGNSIERMPDVGLANAIAFGLNSKKAEKKSHTGFSNCGMVSKSSQKRFECPLPLFPLPICAFRWRKPREKPWSRTLSASSGLEG